MPTGYTADVQSGKVTDFPEFAMQCARAFSALIDLRDAPPGTTIPDEFEPSSYYSESLEKAREDLADLQAMDEDGARQAAGAAYDRVLAAHRESEQKRLAERVRYEAMLDQALAWEPPTPEHVEMKSFMVSQLEESIRFDCGYEWPAPNRADYEPEKWLAEEISRAEESLERRIEDDRKERERAVGKTAWVKALRDSLASL